MSLPLVFLLAGLSAPPPGPAHPTITLADDWKIVVDGQLRPRLFVHTGLDFKDAGQPTFVTQRARLGVTLVAPGDISLTVRLQDVRIWGEEGNTLNDFSANGFDVHEAFGAIPLFDVLTLKLGRQELWFDNHRLIGNVAWAQRARSFDGVRLTYVREALTLDGFYAKVIETDQNADGNVPADRPNDTDLGVVHLTYGLSEQLAVNLLYVVNGSQTANDLRHTMGAFFTGKGFSGFGFAAEGFYQAGKRGADSVSAFMAALNANYTLEVATKPKLTLWGELLSGDGTPQGTFDTLYATNHKFYGEMDLFLLIGPHTANLGLMDLGGQLAFVPVADTLAANLDVHWFQTMEQSATGRGLGVEVDAALVYTLNKWFKIRALYGLFAPGEGMRTVKKLPAEATLELEHLLFVEGDLAF